MNSAAAVSCEYRSIFRSPISPASACTSAISSVRSAISFSESAAALEMFFPGILIPNHQSRKKNATTASAMRRTLRVTRGNMSRLAHLHIAVFRMEFPSADRYPSFPLAMDHNPQEAGDEADIG